MQHSLEVDATDVIDMDIGQRIAEPCLIGQFSNHPTGAVSIMPAIPQLEDQQDTRKEHKTECVKRKIFDENCVR